MGDHLGYDYDRQAMKLMGLQDMARYLAETGQAREQPEGRGAVAGPRARFCHCLCSMARNPVPMHSVVAWGTWEIPGGRT